MIALDPHATDKDGWNALYYSILANSLESMQFLVKHGLQATTNQHGMSQQRSAVTVAGFVTTRTRGHSTPGAYGSSRNQCEDLDLMWSPP